MNCLKAQEENIKEESKMGQYKVYICDVCGSESAPTQNQFKPDEWFYGRVDNVHITLPFVNGFKGEDGHFCSVNCAKLFLGSLFLAWKTQVEAECEKHKQYNGKNFNRNGLIMTAEDEIYEEPEKEVIESWY
jgi:hypothetical protein